MRYDILFKILTRLCAEMVAAGGSSELILLRMQYICKEYGLIEPEFIIDSNGILGSAIAPDGTNLTAIRSIDGIGQNFGKLDCLDEYCVEIIKNKPSAEEIDLVINKINEKRYLSQAKEYIASIFLGTGFAALFGCDLLDAIIAVIACIIIVFVGSRVKKYSNNQFFNNAVVCMIVEFVILIATKYLKICTHPESVSLGVIMLLISGLSFSDGLWSMINKETKMGIYKLNNAMTGAIGIVIGIATPLLIINKVEISGLSINAPIFIQVIECILACGGFAVLCCTDMKYVPVVALGAGLSWIVYAPLSKVIPSLFVCMALSTFAVTLYSLIISKKLKLNPNITRLVGILPLVPGTNLFYMLYGLVTQNRGTAAEECTKLITACLGICFGFALGRLLINFEVFKITDDASIGSCDDRLE